MYWNYLVTAFRNIMVQKLHCFINIIGLALGLTCAIFIILFIQDELSYDQWIPDTEHLYRIEKTYQVPGRDPIASALVPFALPAAMREEIPEVMAMTRLSYSTMTLTTGNRQFRDRVAAVDPNFFAVIKLPLLQGDPAGVFRGPETAVLTDSAARKYFGTSDAIGKILTTTANCEVSNTECRDRVVSLKITGILRDIPHNSQLDGDVFLPNTSVAARISQKAKYDWFTSAGFGYVALAPGAQVANVVDRTGPLFDRAVTSALHSYGIRLKGSQAYSIYLTPFLDVHLTSSRWRFNEKPGGSRATLYGAAIIGALVLLIACFNFMNLTTVLASLRAREIGLRKSFGARRKQLIVQFLGEAILISLISLILALLLVEVLTPIFVRLLQHPVNVQHAGGWLLLFFTIAVLVGLLSGLYPAFVLSHFRPAAVLRGRNSGRGRSGIFQTTIIVLQFAVSIGLGVAVLVIFSQINFARNLNLGFEKHGLLVISGDGQLTLSGRESFVQQLRTNSGISEIALTDALPFDTGLTLSVAQLPGHSETITLNRRVIGVNLVQLLRMRLVSGRPLSDERSQDQFDSQIPPKDPSTNEGHNILIDEAAANVLGFKPSQAVGKTIIFARNHVSIVGVLSNVKFDGAREPTKPTVYVYDPRAQGSAIVRLHPETLPQTLAFIDHTWHGFAPTKAVNRFFLDSSFGKLYQADERQGETLGIFVFVAIFIACLGIFGLAAFTVSRRTKEIGIRKVFGASTRDLIFLLLWQFSVPVVVANVIAWPVAWYYLRGWLQGFAFHISLSPVYFFGVGVATMLITWVTVLTHVYKVARANPINALRDE